jgi:hypothetical protein
VFGHPPLSERRWGAIPAGAGCRSRKSKETFHSALLTQPLQGSDPLTVGTDRAGKGTTASVVSNLRFIHEGGTPPDTNPALTGDSRQLRTTDDLSGPFSDIPTVVATLAPLLAAAWRRVRVKIHFIHPSPHTVGTESCSDRSRLTGQDNRGKQRSVPPCCDCPCLPWLLALSSSAAVEEGKDSLPCTLPHTPCNESSSDRERLTIHDNGRTLPKGQPSSHFISGRRAVAVLANWYCVSTVSNSLSVKVSGLYVMFSHKKG